LKKSIREVFKEISYEDQKHLVVNLTDFQDFLKKNIIFALDKVDKTCFYYKFKFNEEKENLDLEEIQASVDNLVKNSVKAYKEKREIKENGNTDKQEHEVVDLISNYLLNNMISLKEFLSPLKEKYIVFKEKENDAKITYLDFEIFNQFLKESLRVESELDFVSEQNKNIFEYPREGLLKEKGIKKAVNLTVLDKLLSTNNKKFDRPSSKYQKYYLYI
jgi:hypothetical protein